MTYMLSVCCGLRIMADAAEIVQECDGSGLCSHSSTSLV